MKKSVADRRKKERVPNQSRIKHSLYQVLGTPVFEENSTVDLSATGISFETEREYQVGALVLLEVMMGEDALKLLVCVAWVKKDGTGNQNVVGAELIAVDPVHKRKMLSHLNQLIQSLKPKTKKKTAKKSLSKKKVTKKKVLKKKAAKKRKKS